MTFRSEKDLERAWPVVVSMSQKGALVSPWHKWRRFADRRAACDGIDVHRDTNIIEYEYRIEERKK